MTSQVALVCDNSAGWPRHRRTPLKSTASGASTQVSKSSLPVLTKVPSEVKIRKNMDARKKRSAGSDGGFAGSAAEAAISVKFHGSTRRRARQERPRMAVQKITRQARAERAAGAASAARAALRVRLEIASEEGEMTSESGIAFAPGTRGSCATGTRKGCNVMAWCVTVWRAAGNRSNWSVCFGADGGRISLR